MRAAEIFIIAGEPSGDVHGKHLIEALLSQGEFKIAGVGGPQMRSTPFEPVLPMEEFQVMGFSDVLLALPKLVKHFSHLVNVIMKSQPKAVVFIDYPGFNLRLAKALRKKGFKNKLIHYISPSVWAWGQSRIQHMAKTLDLLMTVYPFEPKYFQHTNLKTLYVGNPLITDIKAYPYQSDWKVKNGFSGENKLAAIFPGSRTGEIARNFPVQMQAAALYKREDPSVMFGISCAQESFTQILKSIASQHGLKQHQDYELIPQAFSYDLMQNASFALAKSGTVTLELALHGCPTLVTFQLNTLNYAIAKYLIRINLPHYCIANILLGEGLFPEVIGRRLKAKPLVNHLISLQQNERVEAIKAGSLRLKKLLGDQKASMQAAEEIGKLIS